MVNVILLAPLYGNGGIASWTKKYIDTFPTEEFRLIPISSVLSSKNMQAPIYERLRKGGQEVGSIIKQLNLKSATPFPKCYLHKEKWTFDS